MRTRALVAYAPAVALLAFWVLAGLASAITVARADGSLRHPALGIVTLPFLVLVARAVRATSHSRSNGTGPVARLQDRS
jgi:hypothetical protein